MIYVAAHSRIADVAQAFASVLASAGIEVTSSWHDRGPGAGPDEIRAAAIAEAADIRRSRVVVAFLTHGSREAIAVGAFAIGIGVPVIFVGHLDWHTRILDQENVWWVEFFGDAVDMVKKQYGPDAGSPADAG